MKKIIIPLLLVLFCVGGSAQTDDHSRKSFPSHEIGFNIGDPSFFYNYFDDNYAYSYHSSWMRDDVYTKWEITSPALSFTYLYHPLKWLWFGASIAYSGNYHLLHDLFTDERVGTESTHLLSVAPYIRFSFLNKEKVNLYSGISLGAGYSLDIDTMRNNIFRIHITGQLTAFGVSFGKSVVGFAELGYGHKGIVNMGIGYRFNAKKRSL